MKIIVLPQAADEFDDATAYHDQQQSGLGHRFRDEVDRHIRWIGEHPDVPQLRPGGYRRVTLKILPHYTAYMVQREEVWVLAIAHAHSRPEYWIGRA